MPKSHKRRCIINFQLRKRRKAAYACTLNVTDVEAVLTSLVRKLPLYLKNGFKIQLGNFGRVKLSFSSKGFEKAEDVDASSITAKRILFTPSSELKNEIEKASFSKV